MAHYVKRRKKQPAPPPGEWHTKGHLNDLLENYHRDFCRQPKDDIQTAKESHTSYMRDLQDGLNSKLLAPLSLQRFVYTGSSYEGVKVSDGLEFDVMIVLNGNDLDPQEVRPGYASLRPSPECPQEQFAKVLDGNGNISAEKLRQAFQGSVQKVLNDCRRLKDRTQLTPHGPAVQMDVYKTKEAKARGKKEIWFSVDLVPTVEILTPEGDRHCYVAKPLTDQPRDALLRSTWRRSFSIQEKDKFEQMDSDNGRRKQCLRILKVLRTRTGMKLTSYHLKTLLFHEMERHTSWRPDQLAVRVLGLLDQLKSALQMNQLSHYFLPQINLLDTIPRKVVTDMHNQIDKLLKNQKAFEKTFASVTE